MDKILEIKNLNKGFDDFQLKNISLSVPTGTIVGLIGENGTGKSTIINLIENLLKEDSGEIYVFGENMRENEKRLKQKMGIIYDTCHYNEKFKCQDIENMMKLVYDNWDSTLYNEYLDKFNLPRNKRIEKFSKGMKMKLCFAAELAQHPRLLILDEATSGLDPIIRDEILEILQEFIMDENNGVLMSSHITSDLDKIADYIIFIHEGEIMFTKSYEDIHDHFGLIHCGQKVFEAMDKKDILAYKKEDFEYKVLVEDRESFAKIYQDLVIDKATIEDVMLLYVRGTRINESINL